MINPYSSITNNSTQVQILYGVYANSPEFNPMNDFVIVRTGEYEYTLYYGIDLKSGTKSAKYIQYYRSGNSSVNYIYKIRKGISNNFSLNTETYLSVGTIENTIQLIDYETTRLTLTTFICVLCITIVTIFNIIRGHIKR